MSFDITAFNNNILRNISNYGLIPNSRSSAYGTPLLSSDETSAKDVSVNIFYPINDGFRPPRADWITLGINDLMSNTAKGLFPIVAERAKSITSDHKWVLFDNDSTSFVKRMENIYRSSVYLQINTNLLPAATDIIDGAVYVPYYQGKVYERTFSEITPRALMKGFVPRHLVNLFKEIFPQLPCVPVEDILKDMALYIPQHVQRDPAFEQEDVVCGTKFFTCKVPDYQSHIEKLARLHFSKNKTDALTFHVVRLACEEDVPFHTEAAAAAAE